MCRAFVLPHLTYCFAALSLPFPLSLLELYSDTCRSSPLHYSFFYHLLLRIQSYFRDFSGKLLIYKRQVYYLNADHLTPVFCYHRLMNSRNSSVINIDILLRFIHSFLMTSVGRICLSIKTCYL